MNTLTKNLIMHCMQIRAFYSMNKDHMDNIKSISRILPLVIEMLKMCHVEFERSVAYIRDYNLEKEKKRREIEKISRMIKKAIHRYSREHNQKIHIDEKAFFEASMNKYTERELLDHLKRIQQMVSSISGHLVEYGITNALMVEFDHKIHDLIPAMPLNFDEIEQHRKRYRSALRSVHQIEKYIEFH